MRVDEEVAALVAEVDIKKPVTDLGIEVGTKRSFKRPFIVGESQIQDIHLTPDKLTLQKDAAELASLERGVTHG